MKLKHKTGVSLFLFLAFVISIPALLLAGGLQEKIQQKINASKNMQQAAQYEPYYVDNEQQSNKPQEEGKSQQARKAAKADRDVSADMLQRAEGNAPVFSSYAIYRTDYKAEIEEDVVTVKGSIVFEVFKKGWTQIPLAKNTVGLIEVSVNRGTSFVVMQSGKYYLMIDKPGRYTLDMEFLIKASRERENGPGNFSFESIPALISQFEFAMEEDDVEIFVEPSIRLEVKKAPKKTVAWAVMPNTNTITVRWSKALPKETITPVKLEPKVYVDTVSSVSIGEGLIRCQSILNYSILQSEISNARIALPEDIAILDVQGKNLRDWKISQKENLQYVDVYFTFGTKGNYTLNVTYERKIGDGSVVAQIPWIQALGAEREKGFLGLAAATNVELAINKTENATLIDVKELPSSLWGMTANPILLAFKYLKHPFTIAIDVTKHEEVPVLVATIDSAAFVTLQTNEGKSLTKAIYQLRNNVKQYLRLTLPEESVLWSVFVAGKPVKPAKDKNGHILIPLEKSQLREEGLTQFPVEIVYLDKTPTMKFLGNIKLNLPQNDIPISSLQWSLYLPSEYAYFNFGGDVKQVKASMFPVADDFRTKERAPMSKAAGYRLESNVGQQFAGQSVVTEGFYDEVQSAQMKGVLPIRIDIPQEGKLFYFSKLIVTEKESPSVSVRYCKGFRHAFTIVKLLLLVIFIVLFAAGLKKIFPKMSRQGS